MGGWAQLLICSTGHIEWTWHMSPVPPWFLHLCIITKQYMYIAYHAVTMGSLTIGSTGVNCNFCLMWIIHHVGHQKWPGSYIG